MRLRISLLLAPLLLGGCVITPPGPAYSACRAMATSDWTARVEVSKEAAPPFPRESVLVVSGTVQVPSGGYRLALDPGPVLKLEPPVQQMILRTDAPDGMATQAIVDAQVSGSVKWDPKVKSVSIRCGDGTIASIPAIVDNRPPRTGG